MSEIQEPRRHPMVIPLVDHVERVLGNLEPSPTWYYGPEDTEREPATEAAVESSSGGNSGGNNRVPPRTLFGEPFDVPPFGGTSGPRRNGPLGGYRSFRYFDPTQPEHKLFTGRAVPDTANIWGVMLPMATIESLARLLHFNRAKTWPKTVSEVDKLEARGVLYEYFLVHFLVDRACDIIENILKAATGATYDLFLSDVFVPGRTKAPTTLAMLSSLSYHRVHHHATSRGMAHKKCFGRPTADPSLPCGTVGATYAQLLSDLLSIALHPGTLVNRPNVERLLGLNFLIGADIPNMNTPDPYYKFPGGGRPIRLPIHVW